MPLGGQRIQPVKTGKAVSTGTEKGTQKPWLPLGLAVKSDSEKHSEGNAVSVLTKGFEAQEESAPLTRLVVDSEKMGHKRASEGPPQEGVPRAFNSQGSSPLGCRPRPSPNQPRMPACHCRDTAQPWNQGSRHNTGQNSLNDNPCARPLAQHWEITGGYDNPNP